MSEITFNIAGESLRVEQDFTKLQGPLFLLAEAESSEDDMRRMGGMMGFLRSLVLKEDHSKLNKLFASPGVITAGAMNDAIAEVMTALGNAPGAAPEPSSNGHESTGPKSKDASSSPVAARTVSLSSRGSR